MSISAPRLWKHQYPESPEIRSWTHCSGRPRYMETPERRICALAPLLLLLLPPVCGEVFDRTADEFKDMKDVLKNWEEARNYCRTRHTDLITIRDETENQAFFHGWIGLYREDSDSEWKWSRGDEIANFTMWRENEPSPGKDCAFKHKHESVWNADRCDAKHGIVCDDERLLLVRESKTWEDAVQHCRALQAKDPSRPATDYQNHRFDLATLLTEDDRALAQSKAQEAGAEVWIGLRFLAGRWMWLGGEAAQDENMRRCPSKRACGTLEVNASTIGAQNCAQKRNFLCYREP